MYFYKKPHKTNGESKCLNLGFQQHIQHGIGFIYDMYISLFFKHIPSLNLDWLADLVVFCTCGNGNMPKLYIKFTIKRKNMLDFF